jgi:hypothetical protein
VNLSGRDAELRAKRRGGALLKLLLASIVTLGIGWSVVPALGGTTSASSPRSVRVPVPLRANVVADVQQKWSGIAATPDGGGYWVVSNGGAVESFGDAASHGDLTNKALNHGIVGMAPTPDGRGYWLDASDGGIFSFGDARFFGSTGNIHLNKPVVGMAPTHDGGGYWTVGSDGGVFAFGDAPFEGSMGAHHLNEPIVGMVPTNDGGGYWMVSSDGGVFAFGDAPFGGSLGANPPSSPIVYMAPSPDNNGYWLVSRGGTIYAFGDAGNYGSLVRAASPATSLTAYWVLTADGAVHPFGNAVNYGSPATGPMAAEPTVDLSSATGPATASPSASGAGSGNQPSSNNGGPDPVTISTLTPSSGTAGGGDTIEISGTGFTGTTTVEFGRNSSSEFTVTSPTTITAVAPVGAGIVHVQVMTPAGASRPSSTNQFTYIPTGQLPITARGHSLDIGGVPTLFTGVNAYQIATHWGTNAGCGGMVSTAELGSFFSSLRPNSIVRFWAFQETMATNVKTGQLDWQPIDNVFYAAAKYHVYLIPAISDQGGTCDGGHWQDPAWYSGGFMKAYNSPDNSDGLGRTPLSYWDYMNALVSRYGDSPALGMWEPMSEAEASACPAAAEPSNCFPSRTCFSETAAATALKYFFTTVGAEIHDLDPTHLVEGGFLGGGQCGTIGSDYQNVGASPGIDVLSVHDYYGSASLSDDPSNGLAVRFAQARGLDKPIITGEVGIMSGIGQKGCVSLQQRAQTMKAKIIAQFAAGDSAFLVWSWATDPLGPCSDNTSPSDSSLLGVLASPPSG